MTNQASYLSDFLKYGTVSKSHIFSNKSTYGFILKLTPFNGIDHKDFNALEKIISYEIPSDAIVQVINYASPTITYLINKWERAGINVQSVYRALSSRRSDFFLKSAQGAGHSGGSLDAAFRNFELYLSISFAKKESVRANNDLIQTMLEIRARIAKAFSNIGCNVEYLSKHGLETYLAEVLFPDNLSYDRQRQKELAQTERVIISTNEKKLRQSECLESIDDTIGSSDQKQDEPEQDDSEKDSSEKDIEQVFNYSSNAEYRMHPDFASVSSGMSSKRYLIFEVNEWPSSWSIRDGIDYVGNFKTGRGLTFPFYISFGYKAETKVDSERQATKMRVIRTNQTTSKLVTFVPAMREEVEDWHYITNEIDKGASLAKSCMYVVAMIGGGADINSAIQSMQDHFYQLGFKLNHIKYDCLNALLNTLPMHTAEEWGVLKRGKALTTMITSSCLNLLPIFADPQNASTPLMLLVGRRGQVFFFDNYASVANGNYNMVVVGKSGSGKSVFLQEYMTSILRQNGQVVVIDDGRSFQNSCKILNGDFVDFIGSNLCINPFSLYPENDGASINSDNDKFRIDFEEPLIDLIVSILCIVANIDKNNTKSFDVGLYREVLKKAVQTVLEQKKGQGGFKDVYEVLLSEQSLKARQTKDIAENLAYVLKEYAIGRYASYYNGKATLSINNLLTIFELSSLESNEVLQTSVLLMVVFLVYVKMQGRQRRTSLIIDEAWRLLRHDAIKGFIEGIARRARKYNGSLIVATQSISDFEENKSAAAAAVLSQSDWRVLLSAEGKDESILKNQLGMSESEVEVACSLRGDRGKFSEFMIRHSSSVWLIGRLMLDPFSSKLYSSKAEEVLEIQALVRQGLSLERAIEHLLGIKSQLEPERKLKSQDTISKNRPINKQQQNSNKYNNREKEERDVA